MHTIRRYRLNRTSVITFCSGLLASVFLLFGSQLAMGASREGYCDWHDDLGGSFELPKCSGLAGWPGQFTYQYTQLDEECCLTYACANSGGTWTGSIFADSYDFYTKNTDGTRCYHNVDMTNPGVCCGMFTPY
jgi:hypothetical protein